jgi:hypothetical protein
MERDGMGRDGMGWDIIVWDGTGPDSIRCGRMVPSSTNGVHTGIVSNNSRVFEQ